MTRATLATVLGLVVSVFLGAGCARLERRNVPPASGASVSGTTVEQIVSGGVTRSYRLHVPPNARSRGALPLVINLHGYNSNAAQEETVTKMSALADTAGFIVVYPEGLGNPASWKFGDRAEGAADVGFVRELIQQLESQFPIKANAVYATGISNGAEMTYRLACDLSDQIAAIGLVSGGYPPFRDCQLVRPVPAVIFHGTADKLLAYEGRPPLMLGVRDFATSWAERNGCAAQPQTSYQKGEVTGETWSPCRNNADVVLYTITGKGHSWPGSDMPAAITTQDINATDVIWQFFTAHPK